MESILYTLLGIVIGGVAGFFIARHFLQKQIKDNPPINEKMIRAMFLQMGRKPSEAQIRQIMKSMGQNPDADKTKPKDKAKDKTK